MTRKNVPEMVVLTNGSRAELSVVIGTMRVVRQLCWTNPSVARELVKFACDPYDRPSMVSRVVLEKSGLLQRDGTLYPSVMNIVCCAFDEVNLSRLHCKPGNPVMKVE